MRIRKVLYDKTDNYQEDVTMDVKSNAGRVRFFPAKDPCAACAHRGDCNEICWHRAKWWDVQMEKLRKVLKEDGHELEK